MSSTSGGISDMVLRYLGEIGAGRCDITEETISAEPDPEMREILIGLLVLHEDLELERSRREEAISARDEFISIASHELRTPLTSIRLQLELLNQSIPGFEIEEKYRFEARTQVLKRQLLKLESLVSDLLDVSRITSGKIDLHPETADLRELAFEVKERIEPEIVRRGVTLLVRAPEPVIGEWDVHRLDQVLTNLLTNALRYGQGKPVDLELYSNGAFAQFSVRDRGIGISPEDQSRIFQPFTRAVSSKHYGGLGLGLWIVRRILEAMGGTVSVESELGGGSLFTVRIPRQPLVLR